MASKGLDGATRADAYLIDPTFIEVDNEANISRWMPPPESAAIDLAISFAKDGNLNPIAIRALGGGKSKLVAGYTRVRAALLLRKGFEFEGETYHLPDFKLYARKVTADEEKAEELNLIENVRTEMTIMDKAHAMHRLVVVRGMEQKVAAKKLGVDPSYVSQLLKLLDLPKKMQMKVHMGSIPARAAMKLAEVDPSMREEFLKDHEEYELTGDTSKRITLDKVAKKVRENHTATGTGARMGLRMPEFKAFLQSFEGPAEHENVRKLCSSLLKFIEQKEGYDEKKMTLIIDKVCGVDAKDRKNIEKEKEEAEARAEAEAAAEKERKKNAKKATKALPAPTAEA